MGSGWSFRNGLECYRKRPPKTTVSLVSWHKNSLYIACFTCNIYSAMLMFGKSQNIRNCQIKYDANAIPCVQIRRFELVTASRALRPVYSLAFGAVVRAPQKTRPFGQIEWIHGAYFSPLAAQRLLLGSSHCETWWTDGIPLAFTIAYVDRSIQAPFQRGCMAWNIWWTVLTFMHRYLLSTAMTDW